MFGVLTIAVRIYQDRWGYGIYSGPIGSAVFIITVKWVSGLKMTILCSSIFFIIILSSSSFYTFCLSSVLCCFLPSLFASSLIFSFCTHSFCPLLFLPFFPSLSPSPVKSIIVDFWVSVLFSLLFQLQKMKQLRAVYPEKTVYTQQVGPGCCFGALALMLRFYFEVTKESSVSWNEPCYALNSLHSQDEIIPFVLCIRSGTTPTSTASTICRWPCPSSCCCQRRIALQGRDRTPLSSAASLSASVYVTNSWYPIKMKDCWAVVRMD